jgi:flagellin-like hook-associated protein FlgL
MRISTLSSSNLLEVSRQNVRASDSQVTGTEMSPAMARFTANQILLHAHDAAPAQANTPQSILDLLQ